MQNLRHNAYICSRANLFFSMDTLLASIHSLRQRTVAFTGRRTYLGNADEELRAVVRDLMEQGFTRFLCGMSWGFDLAAGRIVAELKRAGKDVELVAVEPFAEFRAMFSGEAAALYDEVLTAADERVVVGENDKAAYMRRNDYLVDNASVVVAWWDGKQRGGTAYTVKRARKRRVEVINLYPQPQLELEF